MVDWSDEGIVLAARPHGEGSAVVVLLTRGHGRHAGLVRGAFSGRARGLYQAGNRVTAAWRARLAEHLGNYACELARGHAATVLDDPLKLSALAAACAVAEVSLPEREPHPRVHDGLAALLDAMELPELGDAWIAAYVRWEVGVLADLGYGLDLDSCAVTGRNDDLAYVSPRSGRAVSLSAGEPYRDRLLPLPRFLIGRGGTGLGGTGSGGTGLGAGDPDDLFRGLALSGFFLERHVFATHGRQPPPARTRFVERFARDATVSGGGSTA